MQNIKNIQLPEITNPAKPKKIFLMSETYREKKPEKLKLKVIFQLRVI